MKDIAIIGGGIGGLCCAIGLQRAGYSVRVYESAEKLNALGAGLVLSVNSVRALQQIGLDEVVKAIGYAFDQVAILDQQSRTINETSMQATAETYGVGNFSVHRADLQTVLVDQLAFGTLQLGKQCTDFVQEEQITLRFADGSRATAEALIAFDGIHSPVRQKLLPKVALRYAGYTCWRAVIPYRFQRNAKRFSETWGPAGRFGIVPLADERVYWFATINAAHRGSVLQHYTVADLQRNFQDYHSPIVDLLTHTTDEQLLWNDILDFKPIDRYAFGNVALAGDAAHAMTPNMGQGAGMAIEDAVVLTNCLTRYPTATEAFSRYEALRKSRIQSMVNGSFQLGRIAQLTSPWWSKLRNQAFRSIPKWLTQRQMKSLYNVALDG